MSATLSDAALAGHPAFRGLSPGRLEQLAQQFTARQFSIGQPLCHRSLVPGEVLLILEGEARLLVDERGRPATLVKLGPGDWVGLASLLRVKGCEEVAASSALQAVALPDEALVQLLQEEPAFRTWCAGQVWPAELAALLEPVLSAHPTAQASLRDLCRAMQGHARGVEPTAMAIGAVRAASSCWPPATIWWSTAWGLCWTLRRVCPRPAVPCRPVCWPGSGSPSRLCWGRPRRRPAMARGRPRPWPRWRRWSWWTPGRPGRWFPWNPGWTSAAAIAAASP
ncbi:MAG: Crp/Fnr family transcriptional regulator [Cyanobium sp.]